MIGESAPRPRVVVLACGNPSRGDDALGPALVKRLEAWKDRHPARPVEVVEDFQFQVEHALDLQGRDLAIFIDATVDAPTPVTFTRLVPAATMSLSTHSLSPAAVLQALETIDPGPKPRAYTLAVRGARFEMGQGLSPEAATNLDAAWTLLERLIERPSAHEWEAEAADSTPRRPDPPRPASSSGSAAGGSPLPQF